MYWSRTAKKWPDKKGRNVSITFQEEFYSWISECQDAENQQSHAEAGCSGFPHNWWI